MANNVQGIAITIRAFLPTGKTLDEQFEALSIVKDAHASGDYAKLLTAAKIDEVKTEQKVRRIEDAPAPTTQTEPDTTGQTDNGDKQPEPDSGLTEMFDQIPASEPDAEVPDFLKNKKNKAA